jgi:multiphosphoryl transfer protein
MKEVELVIKNPTGLHARPAKVFVNAAKQFKSDVRVYHGQKKANAKSLISMLTLGVETGNSIRIEVDGADEEVALEALATAVANGLGEEEHIAAAEQAPSPPPTPPPASPPAVDGQVKGLPAAPGIAIGPIYQLQQAELEVEETFAGASIEENRLQTAIEQARGQLHTLRRQMQQRQAGSEAAIFEVHLEILEDPDLLDTVLERIQQKRARPRRGRLLSNSERPRWLASMILCWPPALPTSTTWATASCACWWERKRAACACPTIRSLSWPKI